MSSLAAARADNFYYPPEYDPSKGGLNKFQGQHALRERARKLDQGILIIRFEMPFNVWCAGCNHLIGKGVRFNAEKKQIGNYFSTKIWSFRMKAPCCGELIEVHTDPKNAEYIIVSGARKKVEDWDAEEAGTLELPDPTQSKSVITDPLEKLEDQEVKKREAKERAARINAILVDSESKHKDDYLLNKALRRRVRAVRKDEKHRDAHRAKLGLPEHVKLLPEAAADHEHASLVVFGDPNSASKNWQNRRKSIATESIFSSKAVAAAQKPSGRPHKRTNAQRARQLAKQHRHA